MSDRARQAAVAAQRGDGASGNVRGSARARAGATPVERRDDAARAAKVRRNAWLLAGLAMFFYLGYIAWMFVRASSGS